MNLYKTLICAWAVVTWLTACSTADRPAAVPPLNSERIEARYGNYGVRILNQTTRMRESCLFSRNGSETTCRTLAIVRFASAVPQELTKPLDRIRHGASLGATLADAGWSVTKVNRHIGTYTLSADDRRADDLRIASDLLRIATPADVAIHIYELLAARKNTANAVAHSVATLLELHHPDYLTETLLQDNYGNLPWKPVDPVDLQAWLRQIPLIGAENE